jgi:transposase
MNSMRSHGSAEELERRRLLAVKRVREGRSCAEVARFLGVNERTVRQWYNDAEQGGDAALAAKPRPIGRSRLAAGQEAEVLGWLVKSPADEEFGFSTELWTAGRVADLIRKRFGVKYSSAYLSRWLRARGVTPQMVRRRPRKHDPVAMKLWADEEWPRILKKRPRRLPTLWRSTRPV